MPSGVPSTIRVREATEADLADAERLMRSVITYDPRWHRDIDDLRGAYLDDPKQALFVAETAKAIPEVVGVAVIRKRMPNVPEVARRFEAEVSCELGRVVVDPVWRRRGIAVQLTEAARSWTHGHGYLALHLHTETDNAPALALWRSIAVEIPRAEYREGESVYFDLPMSTAVRAARSRPGDAVERNWA